MSLFPFCSSRLSLLFVLSSYLLFRVVSKSLLDVEGLNGESQFDVSRILLYQLFWTLLLKQKKVYVVIVLKVLVRGFPPTK